VHYDDSVRSSIGGIVQFKYGDDGLDPACMEGDDQPVNFPRNLMHCRAQVHENEEALELAEIREMVEQRLGSEKFQKTCSLTFRNAIQEFMEKSVIEPFEKLRRLHGIIDGEGQMDLDVDGNLKRAVVNMTRLTRSQLDAFLEICFGKYMKAVIEPGNLQCIL
jgi:DNA-directed RNA polymerase III subunit RPC1